MKLFRQLAVLAAAGVIALACGGGGGGTSGSGASCSKTWKVGLVTDVGKLSDKSFNATSWKGVQDAQADKGLCVQGRAIESNQPTDYQKNMQTFVDQGYDMVIAVGFLMTDDVLASAKANPKVKFSIVDGFHPTPPLETSKTTLPLLTVALTTDVIQLFTATASFFSALVSRQLWTSG